MQNIWLIGLGGIGSAIKKQLETQNIQLTSLSRTGDVQINVCNGAEVEEFVSQAVKPDLVIVTSGILYDDTHMPEKSICSFDSDWLHYSVDVNVLPTLNFAKSLSKHLRRQDAIKFASFSARVSSISDNRLGGWHSYRMTKCMLNMLIKNIALEWQLKLPQATIFGYHPGTVDTNLSTPFQARVAQDKLFSPDKAANLFLNCLQHRTSSDSGKLFDWQEKEITP